MKNAISKIERMLKRATHRELSPEELEKARKGFRKESRHETLGFGTDVEYSMEDGEPQLRITERSKQTTRDLSHPEILHTCFYNDRTTCYRYTRDGKLVERHMQEGNIYTDNRVGFYVTRFDPPGCWRGKKIDETERHYTWFG